MILLAQLETVLKTVDKAEGASDRWLFLAALAIIIVGGVLCINWLVKSLERKDKEHSDKTLVMVNAHATERREWALVLQQSKDQFIASLEAQRKDFREEMSAERHAYAAERALEHGTRHASANALNNLSTATQDLRETIVEKLK